ncbi:MAG: DUF418 domain-containing protein [Pseudomonadota bacterium]
MSDVTTAAPATPDTPVTPVSGKERHVSMDVLRGVAIFGILVMNIYGFAMPFSAYSNPTLMGGTDTLNLGIWFFTHIFFDQKFLAIFSMLYGAGIVLLYERALARGKGAGGLFYRRSFWLLLIGLAHGAFVWFGDILFAYAFSGMIMFLFRKRSPKALIIIALFWFSVAPLLSYGGGFAMKGLEVQVSVLESRQADGEELNDEELAMIEQWEQSRAFMAPTPEDVQKDVDAYRGSYSDAFAYRNPMVQGFQIQGTLFFILWRAGGLMLLGMALMKLGVLQAKRSDRFYRNMMLAGYGLGLPIMAASSYLIYTIQWDGLSMFQFGLTPNYYGSVFVALGHIGLVMTLVRSGVLAGLTSRFAAVGRMAFSNYLTHSIVMTSIFYGYGLNLYTEIPRVGQMLFVLGLIGLQLLYSPWWLARFRFGPAEWLWRSLTYWKRQPMRR